MRHRGNGDVSSRPQPRAVERIETAIGRRHAIIRVDRERIWETTHLSLALVSGHQDLDLEGNDRTWSREDRPGDVWRLARGRARRLLRMADGTKRQRSERHDRECLRAHKRVNVFA